MTALNSNLLGLVLLLVGHLGYLDLAATRNDSVLRASEVPDNDLTIDASTNNNVLFVRVELDTGDLDGGLQNIVIVDNVRVSEVDNEHVGQATLAAVLAPLVEV